MRSEEDEPQELILFAQEQPEPVIIEKDKWKVMIVDDEVEIHQVTKLALQDFAFSGRTLQFLSAYSGEEARQQIADNPDVAVILLDVVMETEDAGLRVIQYVRDILNNRLVRIILRTGQPGEAPERKVIVDYDINDYKEKTDLTAQRLFTTMVAALRAYRDILIIEINKRGLERIIDSSASIFELQSMKKFASGILTQLTGLLHLDKNALYCQTSGFAATKGEEGFYILAATGDYYTSIDRPVREAVSSSILRDLELAFLGKESIYFPEHLIVYFKSKNGSENLVYLEGINELTSWDKDLIKIFCMNVSIAFDNIYLNKEVEDTQKEVIFTLGEIAEARSDDMSNHVKRVAEYSKLLALKAGLPELEAEIIRLASPIHDVGKLAIADAVLNKPGKLTIEEFEAVKQHANIGYKMLKNSSRTILKTAAIIAREHHEKYDGSGYPQGLKGQEIHIYGRIIAITDVFDALSCDRVYKKAWQLDAILAYFREQRGRQFDPQLIDIFFENLEEVLAIRESFPANGRA